MLHEALQRYPINVLHEAMQRYPINVLHEALQRYQFSLIWNKMCLKLTLCVKQQSLY